MNITISNSQKDLPLKGLSSTIKAIVNEVLTLEKMPFSSLSIVFVGDAFMRKLHDQFFQDPTSTDVITFPLQEGEGELYICPETAISYAKKHRKEPYEELTLYLVHGLLHLVGLDDIDPKARKKMRKSEKKHMSNLRKKGLILASCN